MELNIQAIADEKIKAMNNKIILTLRELGVPAHLEGYEYLKDAFQICLDDAKAIRSVTKNIYPQIAKSFETTPSRVERAIRHAIEVAWDRGDLEVFARFFGNSISPDRGKPTNSEFIATVVEAIRMEQS